VIRALAGPEGAELAALLGGPIEATDVERARKLVREVGGVDQAMVEARRYVDAAVAALDEVAPSDATEHLAATARDLLDSVPA
jgi:geranylgeranyl pyrophosphate synthase